VGMQGKLALLVPLPTGVSSLLCAPGVISILRRHCGTTAANDMCQLLIVSAVHGIFHFRVHALK
jgi:hypothetical protein